MKIFMKALAGLVVLMSAIGTGWLTLPGAPPIPQRSDKSTPAESDCRHGTLTGFV
jgi:hypothetical protein